MLYPARRSRRPMIHTAFYKFTALADPKTVAAQLRHIIPETLLGSILVATEGINGMLAGPESSIDAFEAALVQDAAFEGAFDGMVFKRSPCITRPFSKLLVQVKKEIVPLGIEGVDGRRTGVQVRPQDWRKLITEPDVVLIDNRNSFEFELGHFEGAIDPQVNNFRDFPQYVREHIDEWKAQGKRVAMYCTGGIRCEKTSAWMLEMGVPVLQLEGGILNYFKQMPDAALDWRGECFVFDNRVALDTNLRETSTTLDAVNDRGLSGTLRQQWERREAAAPAAADER